MSTEYPRPGRGAAATSPGLSASRPRRRNRDVSARRRCSTRGFIVSGRPCCVAFLQYRIHCVVDLRRLGLRVVAAARPRPRRSWTSRDRADLERVRTILRVAVAPSPSRRRGDAGTRPRRRDRGGGRVASARPKIGRELRAAPLSCRRSPGEPTCFISGSVHGSARVGRHVDRARRQADDGVL